MEQEKNKLPDFSKSNSGDISLVDFIRPLWIKRKFIFILTLIFMLIGLFIALFSPVQYTSTCTVVPQSVNKSGSGGLSSVASIMGVNLGTAILNEGTLSPAMYPEIIKSVPFTQEIMMSKIIVDKSEGKPITLYEYYSNDKYKSFNLVNVVKRYTLGLPGTIIGLFKNKNEVSQYISSTILDATLDTIGVYFLSSEELKVHSAIQRSVQLTSNSREGYVTIGYTFPEAYASAQITDYLYRTLEEYVSKFKSEKLNDNFEFVEKSYETARMDFLETQNRLTNFQDANRGLTTASARSIETQLRNEYDIAFAIYRELATQKEQAKIALKENQTILTLINPPVVPQTKSAPNRSMILFSYTIIGILIAFGWVLAKPFFIELIRQVKQDKKE